MGIPGGPNLLLMRRAAAAADDAYQIERSLRFNSADTPKLSRTFSLGNVRTLTWSGWVKRNKLGAKQSIFGAPDTGNTTDIEFDSSDRLIFTDGGSVYAQTTAVFRDPSAWYHIVLAHDTTEPQLENRVKLYVNGKIQAVTTQNYGLNSSSDFGTAGVHTIGSSKDVYSDVLLADVYYIDGLALSPAAFGSFDDSTGVFNPKAFARPAPNKGTTWSGMVTGSVHSASSATYAFDGRSSTQAQSSNGGELTFTPTGGLDFTTFALEYAWCAEYGQGNPLYLKVNDIDISADLKVNDGSGDNCASNYHLEVDLRGKYGITKISTIKWTRQSDGDMLNVHRIIIDGVTLVDGKTDPTTINNPYDGTTWSSVGTASNWDSGANYGIDKAFRGYTAKSPGATGVSGGDGATSTDTSVATYDLGSSNKITGITNLQIFAQGHPDHFSGTNLIKINDTDISTQLLAQTTANTWNWIDLGSTFSEFQKIEVKNWYYTIGGIKVNHHILSDTASGNSFHLKFNDITRKSALGKDTLNGAVNKTGAAPTGEGAYPFYDTTDDYGDVKGSGTRTDSNSGDLVFAMPGTTLTDVSTSPHTMTNNGVTVSTDESRFYGSSLYFSGDSLSAPYHADFLNGHSGNFTIEAWVKTTASSRSIMGVWNWSASKKSWNMYIGGSGPVLITSVDGTNQVDYAQSSKTCHTGKWCHVAFVRNSNTIKCYVDGVETGSSSFSGTLYDTTDSAFYIGGTHGAGEFFGGNIQDARIYHAAKYTASFKPPVRNDFTVNNLNPTAPTLPTVVYGQDTSDNSFDTNSTSVTVNTNGYTYTVQTSPFDDPSGNANAATVAKTQDGSNVKWRVATDSTNRYIFTSTNGTNWSSPGTHYDTDGSVVNITASHICWAAGSNADPATISWELAEGDEGIDSLTDSPTNYTQETGSDKDGGVTRGNYATLNPLENGGLTVLQGNLAFTDQTSAGWDTCKSSMYMSSGKWYMEMTIGTWNGSGAPFLIGVADNTMAVTGVELGQNNNSWCFLPTGQKRHNSSTTSHGSTWSSGKIIGVAVDLSGGLGSGKMWVSIDGTWQASGNPATGANAAFTDIGDTGEVTFAVANAGGNTSDEYSVNYGQRPFNTAAPTGFSCLCTQNLDDTFSGADVNNPSKYFDIKTYTGTGAANQPIKGFNFQPDLWWSKKISGSNNSHHVVDAIRSGDNVLLADATSADDSDPAFGLTFESDGVLQDYVGSYTANTTDETYVAFAWDAGTAAATASSEGSITPSAQWVNTTAGFSITKWTATNANATIGHGLSAIPKLIILKRLETASDWGVYHEGIGNTVRLKLNTHGGTSTHATFWQNESPDADVFSVGTSGDFNGHTDSVIAYCWAPIAGYSSFGSYTGTGTTTGRFVYTGFAPKFLAVKNCGSGGDWQQYDVVREKENPRGLMIELNDSDDENDDGYSDIDFLSNGFKIRDDGNDINLNTETHVYMAFAEHPYKTARAR